uniref:SFRICE_020402 n=1 Tax=Spodoptera frugiperda TaxID=7108 RepID=A0A2H1VUP8_SPOFR
MQLTRPGLLAKSTVSTVVKNASCSRGWLRLVVQTIFATITVASFILILLMAVPTWPSHSLPPPPPPAPPTVPARCHIDSCRITCFDTPYFGEYEDHIIRAVMTVEENNCVSIVLTLESPMFIDNTMPPKWLDRLRTNHIHHLVVTDGNLEHIPSDAFMSQCCSNIRLLHFKNLKLKSWTPDSFVGLSNLEELYIKNIRLAEIPRDALRALHDTLQSLSIIRSNYWNPRNITGMTIFSRLETVDFSTNNFKDVLGANSFIGLRKCKTLYLNSCGITSIGAGTFDSLVNIKMLYLHNNQLTTLPPGLLSNVVAISDPRPRINLQYNFWECDCSAEEIRRLTRQDVLLTVPVCASPEYFKDKSFSDLEAYCSGNNYDMTYGTTLKDSSNDVTRWWEHIDDICGFFYVSQRCYHYYPSGSGLRMLSPVHGHRCLSNDTESINIIPLFLHTNSTQLMPERSWIKMNYFIKTQQYSIVEINATDMGDYGLVWYQTNCPHELYCISDVPAVFRIYNIDIKAEYVFCPIKLSTGKVEPENCVIYHNNNNVFDFERGYYQIEILLYIVTGMVCLILGALCVYAVIRKHPHLLKGSKRILFVKHKSVDALVLPPKVPLRNDFSEPPVNESSKKIFIVPANHVNNVPSRFKRNKSVRSNKSSAPSYISALQPTEDQLAEWRIRHHFNNDVSLNSMSSELSTFSWVSNDEGLYYSIDVDNYKTYESVK